MMVLTNKTLGNGALLVLFALLCSSIALLRPAVYIKPVVSLAPSMQMQHAVANFGLPPDYESRLENDYFVVPPKDKIVHQPSVYSFALHIALVSEAIFFVDVGCGKGERLVELHRDHPEITIVGLDFGDNIAYCKKTFGFGVWFEVDFNTVTAEQMMDMFLSKQVDLSRSVLVHANVIEHLVNPTPLMKALAKVMEIAPTLVLSTPDRVRNRGVDHKGPPPNPAHVREWTLSELESYVHSQGLNTLFSGFTNNNNVNCDKKTSLLVIGKSSVQPHPPVPSDYRIKAFVSAHNEEDAIGESIQWLLDQGVEVHVIDNWSTDKTFAIVEAFSSRDPRVTVERYPVDQVGSPVYDPELWNTILARKAQLSTESGDMLQWALHWDADEIRMSPWKNMTLRDSFYVVDQMGFNAVDFTVLNFWNFDSSWEQKAEAKWRALVDSGAPFDVGILDSVRQYCVGKRNGYFNQIKAWKPVPGWKVRVESGGHEVWFPGQKVFPYKFLTLHYPVRGPKALEKIQHISTEYLADGKYAHIGKKDQEAEFLEHLFPFTLSTYMDDFLVERLSGVGYSSGSSCEIGKENAEC